MRCDWCGSTNLRTSRFRMPDLFRLICLQYPVRCHGCHQRSFASLFSVWKLPIGPKAHRSETSLGQAHQSLNTSGLRKHLKCAWCRSTNIRISRFQLSDLPRLLRLQYPVRCRTCRERSYKFLFSIWKLPKGAKIRRRDLRLEDAPHGAESDARK